MPNELWSSKLTLGEPLIDAAHQDLLEGLAQLTVLSDEQFGECFPTWVAKVENDFYSEEKLMEEINFPGISSHLEQHARVLSALHHAESRVMEGNIALGREVIGLLPQWFEIHVSTMDRVLVTALRMAQEEQQTPFTLPPSPV